MLSMSRVGSALSNPKGVIGAFLVSGTIHLVRPSVFEPLVPKALPRAREIVYVSGVAELVCAAGLLAKARWAAPASVALLLCIWPGNAQMALDSTRKVTEGGGKPGPVLMAAAAWARMPLQVTMIRAVWSTRAAPQGQD
jgi:uncharacterized membrane protein